jgi:hypothetical protein
VGGGGSEWVSWCGGGSVREVIRSRQVIVCGVVTSEGSAFEDGTDRWFRNVGIQKSETGDTSKRLLTKRGIFPEKNNKIKKAN